MKKQPPPETVEEPVDMTPVEASVPAAPQLQTPKTGGSYLLNPETGELSPNVE